MKKLSLIFVLAALTACSGSTVDIPRDFSIAYSSANALMNWELNFSVSPDLLKIDYKNHQEKISGNGIYSITDSEAKKIYRYMKSSGFLTMTQPEGEQIVDMPTQTLKGTAGGNSNHIEFGTVKEPSETLTKLKQMLFDLAAKYHPKWKKDMGFE